jgi:hypothetical protein
MTDLSGFDAFFKGRGASGCWNGSLQCFGRPAQEIKWSNLQFCTRAKLGPLEQKAGGGPAYPHEEFPASATGAPPRSELTLY